MIRHVLAAVDGSDGSRRAAAFAHELSQRLGARLTLLHVVETVPATPFTPFGMEAADHYERRLLAGQQFLDELAQELGTNGAERVIQCGRPPEVICTEAAERDADIIVVGSHGHGSPARLLPGSVGQKVMTLAGRTVTVVP